MSKETEIRDIKDLIMQSQMGIGINRIKTIEVEYESVYVPSAHWEQPFGHYELRPKVKIEYYE